MGKLVYRAVNVDPNWLNKNDFFFSRTFSDEDDKVYIHRFPVYRWSTVTTLEGEMRYHTMDDTVSVDVYDGWGLTRSLYAPFYYEADSCHRDFIDEIVRAIEKESLRLGLEKIEE